MIEVTGNDIAPFGSIDCSSIAIVSQPAHGTVAIQGCNVVYTSDGSTLAGIDTFGFLVSEEREVPCYGEPAVVSIDVLRTVARNDAFIQACGGGADRHPRSAERLDQRRRDRSHHACADGPA